MGLKHIVEFLRSAKSTHHPARGVRLWRVTEDPTLGIYWGEISSGCQIGPEHHPDNQEIILVTSGQVEMVCDGAKCQVICGHTVKIEPEVFHSPSNLGYNPFQFIVIATPDFVWEEAHPTPRT